MPPKPAKSGKTEGKRLLKNCLQDPYNLTWPKLEKGVNFFIVSELKKFLQQHPELKKVKSAGKRKNSSEKQVQNDRSEVDKSSDISKHFFLGVNSVTKKLERGTLSLVLVCKSARPDILTHHLIPLCASRGTPAASISGLSETLSQEFGLKSVLVFGVSEAPVESGIPELVQKISPKIPTITVPWLRNSVDKKTDDKTENVSDGADPSPITGSDTPLTHLPARICVNQSIANKKQKKKRRTQ